MDKIEKADLLRDLQQHSGWKLVEDYIRSRLDDHHKRLLHCELDEVIKHQHRHEAYKSVLDFVKLGIQDGLRALEKDS